MPSTKYTLSPVGRTIAISDVHGHLPLLKSLLRSLDYAPSRDTLVFVGDLVERGAFALDTVRYVMELAEPGRVVLAQGNHDRMQSRTILYGEELEAFRQYYLTWGSQFLLGQMCAELGLPLTSGEDIDAALPRVRAAYAKELSFLEQAPAIVECGRYVFVHGGLCFPVVDDNLSLDPYRLLKNDEYLRHPVDCGRWQVVGHWPVTNYRTDHPCADPIVDEANHVVAIDGGCGIKTACQLNAMVIPDCTADAFSFTYEDDFPLYVSPVDQAASDDPVYLRWSDPVEVLERDHGTALVQCRRTGRRMWVAEGTMWSDGDNQYVNDATDYRLPVFKGEWLRLIHRSPSGALCKQGGSVGWVFEK